MEKAIKTSNYPVGRTYYNRGVGNGNTANWPHKIGGGVKKINEVL